MNWNFFCFLIRVSSILSRGAEFFRFDSLAFVPLWNLIDKAKCRRMKKKYKVLNIQINEMQFDRWIFLYREQNNNKHFGRNKKQNQKLNRKLKKKKLILRKMSCESNSITVANWLFDYYIIEWSSNRKKILIWEV